MESLFKPDQALSQWLQAWVVNPANPRPLARMTSLRRRKGENDTARILLTILERWPTPLDENLKRELKKERLFLGPESARK